MYLEFFLDMSAGPGERMSPNPIKRDNHVRRMKERFEATADTKERYLYNNMLTTTNLLTVWRVDSHNFVISMLLFLAPYFDILPTDVNG